mmetsp:Transcript_36195/g.73581  ORF Transcript_36195/g.73581 Transcript_36195/m.73581 type:complete len:579 (+) Transcript_36195:1338-3074(+)
MTDNATMQNTITTLQAELKAAKDGLLASNGTDGTTRAESNDDESTAAAADGSTRSDESQIEGSKDEGLSPADEIESNTYHTDIPEDIDGELRPNPSGGTSDEDITAASAAASPDECDTAVETAGVRESKRSITDKIVSRLRVEVDKFVTGAQENYARNLVAVTFPTLLDSVVESAVRWARGEVPIENILRIATDAFDLLELNQEVNEQTGLHISTSTQRIRRGCLGAMIHALNESIGEEDGQSGEELVEAGKRAVADLRMIEDENGSCDTVDELFETTKLGDCGRSILNSLLHLVAVVEALRKKEVSTITEFGSQGKKRGTVDRKKADEAALKAAFADFCPGATWNDCRASVLVCAMMKFLAGENLDERRKRRAIAAMAIILDKRLVLDHELWTHVDAFTLSGESSEQKFFTISGGLANRRRYSALHYMLMLCLGGHIGEAIEATDDDSSEFEWIHSSDIRFQELFLLCSVGKARVCITDKGPVKSHLFGIGGKVMDDVALDDGIITNGEAIASIRALVKFAKGRKEGKKDKSESKAPFGADKTILFDLDVLSADASFEAAAELIERVYTGRKGREGG